MIGETLGSYTIVKRLGAGGMGEVYLAQHARIDRRAAIKVLLPELSSNQEVVDRFFAEARSTSSIRHKGIVEVLDCDVHPSGRAYIVMELLEGESLAARLARDPTFGRDLGRVLHVAGAVADAVGAAHGKGIVHRDLKPDNVFLETDPGARFGFVVKILDFGIAKLMGTDAEGGMPVSSRTRTGSLMGTPAYMSPEQCRGASRVDHRTDIYSLGCIAYEMLAGRLPFVYAGFGEIISAHLHETPPALASLGVAVPPMMADWIDRMLAKSPDRRYQTMAEVAAAARGMEAAVSSPQAAAIFHTVPAAAVKAAVAPAAALSGPPGSMTTLSEQAAEKIGGGSSSRFKQVAIALGVLIAGGGGIALVVARRPAPAAVPAVTAAALPAPEIETVTISVSDPPEGLSVTFDGKASALPVTVRKSSAQHELTFRASGFKERVMRLDATTSRVVTLAMQPIAAPPPARPAPTNRSETKKHRTRGASEGPALTDDARKL